ncbi:spore germination protein [Fictibacillus aquaticus]|uniref:Spore germination protein n=1 Tax=Fictibacillus aquaticus TaxID=2021314 RepID=A0A235F6Z0_9BACL|nr:spore germination protein [Fictibacillus aquaticus]OYD56717.1 spore germination protein [Fictibacillus aquaticus]
MRWRGRKSSKRVQNESLQPHAAANPDHQPISGSILADLAAVKESIGHNSDVRFREYRFGPDKIPIVVVYVAGLSDKELINDYIVNMLLMDGDGRHINNHELRDYLFDRAMPICELKEASTINSFTSSVMTGAAGLLVEGVAGGFTFGESQVLKRNMEEPPSESMVRGPRIGFIESLSHNTALLRRLAKTDSLAITSYQIGDRAKKEVAIAYISDIVDPKLLEEVKRRITRIKIDALQESGYIEQLIEDDFLSPFPQVQNTERPDRVLAAVLEGRVAIFLDGTPFALIAPVTFNMLLQTPEDYYERWMIGSLIRMLRYLTAFISLFTPAVYISFVSFHQGLIPTKLVFSIAASREGVPFPPLIEVLIMEVSIEILREAGLRLPKAIGQSIGIVGGLIIGEAAVQAGIVSPIMVIVVAVTAITSFSIPQYNAGIALRMLRFIAMFFAAVFGLYGVILFFLLLGAHLVKLKSFGMPYLSPVSPYRVKDWLDMIIRAPLFLMKKRPDQLQTKDQTRK